MNIHACILYYKSHRMSFNVLVARTVVELLAITDMGSWWRVKLRVRDIIIAPPFECHVTAAPKWLDYLSKEKRLTGITRGPRVHTYTS